jgi:hypothetical protein
MWRLILNLQNVAFFVIRTLFVDFNSRINRVKITFFQAKGLVSFDNFITELPIDVADHHRMFGGLILLFFPYGIPKHMVILNFENLWRNASQIKQSFAGRPVIQCVKTAVELRVGFFY